jgi:drug/metabolite transporter (DMT)-like permease
MGAIMFWIRWMSIFLGSFKTERDSIPDMGYGPYSYRGGLYQEIILYSSTTISFIVWCWFGAIFSFALLFAFKVHLVKEFKRIKIRDLSSYFYLVLCIGTMQYTTNYVFDHMEVGYALALFQLSTIVSIFLGYRIFKEENITKKLIGSVIMVAGSVMIILLK